MSLFYTARRCFLSTPLDWAGDRNTWPDCRRVVFSLIVNWIVFHYPLRVKTAPLPRCLMTAICLTPFSLVLAVWPVCESACVCLLWLMQCSSLLSQEAFCHHWVIVISFAVFQSESEQDEECTGSMGSAAVAVSPHHVFSFCFLINKRLEVLENKHLKSLTFSNDRGPLGFGLGNTHALCLWC